VTDPGYAGAMGITPALGPGQLRGLVLYCGFYDMGTFIEQGQRSSVAFLRWGTATIVRGYTGSRAVDSPELRQMSTIDRVTSAFPPTFLSGGDADPLTDVHSRPFADRLRSLGVDVSTVFYPSVDGPGLGHEYQFDLDRPEARDAFAEMLAFLRTHTA